MNPRDKIRRHPRAAGWIALGAIVTIALIWFVFFRSGKIAPGLASEGARSAQNRPVAVVSRQAAPLSYALVGSVQSLASIEAASRVSARVRAIKVRAGDPVRRGEVLVELDSSDLAAQVRQAEGQLAGARAELARTRADYQRFSALLKRGAVTTQEYDAAEASYHSALGNAAGANAGVAAARAALAYATVRSPVNGIVVERLVEPGDLAVPGNPLVRLYDNHALRVELAAPEELAQKIMVGTPLEVHVGGGVIATRIYEIVPAADPSSRTFLVRAMLPSKSALRPGAYVRATMGIGEETILTIPRTTVRWVGQLATVRVVIDGAAQVRQVALGRVIGNRVEVLAGLNAGDRVIAGPSRVADDEQR